MNDSRFVRYLGYESLAEGGRCLGFSYGVGSDSKSVAISVPVSFLEAGPGRISIQETSSICYETLKVRLQDGHPPSRFDLTAEDIALHRKIAPVRGYVKRVPSQSASQTRNES